MRCCFLTLQLAVIVLFVGRCGDSAKRVCEPGETQSCLCVAGGEGVQVCNAEGTRWEACEGCSSEPPADSSGEISGHDAIAPDGDACGADDVGNDALSPIPDACVLTCAWMEWECGVVCGEDCGSCPADVPCVSGKCGGCQPDCLDKECGPDGCGGKCGSCGSKSQCEEGKCSCSPTCSEVECGDDGCGGSCGTCMEGFQCEEGECISYYWVDSTTGLMWENPPTCAVNGADGDLQAAIAYCAQLEHAGHDDWRLPTIGELRTLIRGCPNTETGGDCPVDDNCLHPYCGLDDCDGCPYLEGPGIDGLYWPPELSMTGYEEMDHRSSSTFVGEEATETWIVMFAYGMLTTVSPFQAYYDYRCVR